jgi:nicotinate phosphoribosyltransferase
MAFASEREAFQRCAEAMPGDVVFLVDTCDSLAGVRAAIEVGRELAARGQRLAGVRLDSGDLAWLSVEARRLLDQVGFSGAAVVAANQLDETLVESLKHQGARIDVWGVGTQLVTCGGSPALDGVYKLAALRPAGGSWTHKISLSEHAGKTSIPGVRHVRRFRDPATGLLVVDAIFDEDNPPRGALTIVDPLDPTRRKWLPAELAGEALLVPLMRDGRCVYDVPAPAAARARSLQQLAALPPWCKRLHNPHVYPVGLELGLAELRTRLVLDERARTAS